MRSQFSKLNIIQKINKVCLRFLAAAKVTSSISARPHQCIHKRSTNSSMDINNNSLGVGLSSNSSSNNNFPRDYPQQGAGDQVKATPIFPLPLLSKGDKSPPNLKGATPTSSTITGK